MPKKFISKNGFEITSVEEKKIFASAYTGRSANEISKWSS